MNADAVATLLALGSAYALPTKMGVDLIKRQLPDLQPWAVLLFAFVLAQALVWLTAVYAGTPVTPNVAAGLFLAGLGATAGAVSATEIHKGTRAAVEQRELDRIDALTPPGDLQPTESDQLLTLIHRLGPERSIVALSDILYRETPEEA